MNEMGEGLVSEMVELDKLDAQILSASQEAFEVEAHDKIRCVFVRGYSFCAKLYSKVLNVQTINEMDEGLVI